MLLSEESSRFTIEDYATKYILNSKKYYVDYADFDKIFYKKPRADGFDWDTNIFFGHSLDYNDTKLDDLQNKNNVNLVLSEYGRKKIYEHQEVTLNDDNTTTITNKIEWLIDVEFRLFTRNITDNLTNDEHTRQINGIVRRDQYFWHVVDMIREFIEHSYGNTKWVDVYGNHHGFNCLEGYFRIQIKGCDVYKKIVDNKDNLQAELKGLNVIKNE